MLEAARKGKESSDARKCNQTARACAAETSKASGQTGEKLKRCHSTKAVPASRASQKLDIDKRLQAKFNSHSRGSRKKGLDSAESKAKKQ